jgi:hypothetical protein
MPARWSLLGALLVLALAGCTATAPTEPPGATLASGTCPVTPPGPRTEGVFRWDQLVPIVAHRLVLCDYRRDPATGSVTLQPAKVIDDAAVVASWTDRFNALPPIPAGVFHCPAMFGDAIVADFVASPDQYVIVTVETSGCRIVHGDGPPTARESAPALIDDLRALVGP